MKEEDHLLIGRKPVLEYLESGDMLESVVISRRIKGEFEKKVRKLCKLYEIPYRSVPGVFFDKFKGMNHQGILAYKPQVNYMGLEELLQNFSPLHGHWSLVLVEGIKDVRNLGAIARSAEVFGADALIVPSKNIAPINAFSVKTSAGAMRLIKVVREKNIVSAIKKLKDHGILVVGTHLAGRKAPSELNLKGDMAWVMGSEEHGLSSEVVKLLDEMVKIPQLGQTDSLNVSVAAGICLYEMVRQRQLEIPT